MHVGGGDAFGFVEQFGEALGRFSDLFLQGGSLNGRIVDPFLNDLSELAESFWKSEWPARPRDRAGLVRILGLGLG